MKGILEISPRYLRDESTELIHGGHINVKEIMVTFASCNRSIVLWHADDVLNFVEARLVSGWMIDQRVGAGRGIAVHARMHLFSGITKRDER